LEEAFGEPPLALRVGYDFSITYLVGPGMHQPRAQAAARAQAERRLEAPPATALMADIPTDDWPQLYLETRGLLGTQLLLVAVLVALSLAGTRALAPFAGRPDAHFALLGAGFLLVETKGIADLGLLFGGTWWTVTTVIAAVLVMALLSVLLVARVRPASRTPFYLGLVVALAAAYLVRPASLLHLPLPAAQLLGAALVAAPVFFSGVVFAISLARTDDVARALGSNLVGAVLGGFLEYASLAWGVRSLSLIAIGLYLLSAAALAGRRDSVDA
jgi:hypothetical protein